MNNNGTDASLVGFAATIFFTSLAAFYKKKNATAQDEKKKEQSAKASFRVRKSNLMSIAGRGVQRKKKQKQQMNRDQLITGGHAAATWHERLMSSCIVQVMAHVLSIISFGYLQLLSDINTSNATQEKQSKKSRKHNKRTNLEEYYDNIAVVGLDCEMVGGGRNGMKSLLARCSVVTLDHIPTHHDIGNNKSSPQKSQKKNITSLNQNLVVLYDKYIIPREKITDYRTEWSGITKSTYSNNNSSIPIVSFHQCQNEITQLFASISNKKVVVVGHALENDFEVLEITHPISLIRDTAFFVPYMRQVKTKMYSRKLSVLSSEELGIDIQQHQSLVPPSLEDEDDDVGGGGVSIQNDSKVGHSSVEDAAAALRLYWNRCVEWEHSLGYPLKIGNDGLSSASEWAPLRMYLDGCNLPVAMRGVDFKELFANPPQDRGDGSLNNNSDDMTDKPKSFSITSRNRDNGNVHTTDWMPFFLTALSPNSTPKLDMVSILWDGAKYRDILKGSNGKPKNQGRVFCSDLSKAIIAEITKDGDTVDDVLFERLCLSKEATTADSCHQQIIPLSKAVNILSSDTTNQTSILAEDSLSHYVVIRRKGGGSKTHRRLFDKLHLRRPDEGAICLSGLTDKLQRHSWKLARDLQREKGIEKVIECELRRRQDVMYVVVTDDVYLTERLMRSRGVMVLSFMQFSNMF
jgi:RNA exonuclease 4